MQLNARVHVCVLFVCAQSAFTCTHWQWRITNTSKQTQYSSKLTTNHPCCTVTLSAALKTPDLYFRINHHLSPWKAWVCLWLTGNTHKANWDYLKVTKLFVKGMLYQAHCLTCASPPLSLFIHSCTSVPAEKLRCQMAYCNSVDSDQTL